jgi:beta-lactam-binding protein with PASTA domain
MSESKAKSLLQSKGFNVVVSSDTKTKSIKKYGLGIVSSQSPDARSKAGQGAQVTIYVTSLQ